MGLDYELVWVETKDRLDLYGLFKEADVKETVLINIHGTASNFYEEDFMENFAIELPKIGISVLSTNNRGAYVMDCYQNSGAALEKFEDCLQDIDSWIDFVIKRGYKHIILSGHSLGTEKVVYYMNKGKYRNKVKAIVLLAPADSYGTTQAFMSGRPEKTMQEAIELEKQGKGDVFLTSLWKSHAGVLPKSASSYINFFKDNSELAQALPLRNEKNLNLYRKIEVPILVAIGDMHEYTVIPTKEALQLMKKENNLTETNLIAGANHDFEGKEEELTILIKRFLMKLIS